MSQRYCSYRSPLGMMTMASDEGGLIGLWFDGQKYGRSLMKPDAVEDPSLDIFSDTRRWLDQYFDGEIPSFLPRLALSGSPFKQMVSQIMLTIPYGGTLTYGAIASEVAKKMGLKSMSAQAVGGAVGHNEISLIVPCHRVLGSNGSLIGYAGGVDRKMWLLQHEGILL